MNIVLISGSPRTGSMTHRVALHLQQYLAKHSEHNVSFVDLQQSNLPPVQAAWPSVDKAPAEHKDLAKTMFEAQAFILVSPEYNGSYSPAMKNLLDHFPKQLHKPFGLVTASPGAFGGLRASQQLQLLVGGLLGLLSPVMLVTPFVDKKFDADGSLIDLTFQASIDTFVTEFLWLVDKVTK